jgi:DNA-binding SARP family transcriptional activator
VIRTAGCPNDGMELSIGSRPGQPRERLLIDIFDAFGGGILVASDSGQVLMWNRAAIEVAGAAVESATRCCDVLGCRRPGTALADGCLTELALGRGGRHPEVILDVPGESGRHVAVVAYAFSGAGGRAVLFEMRPAQPADAPLPLDTIRIRTLGETVLETQSGQTRGDWLHQRTGKLLKFLVVRRFSVVPADAITEAMWPRGGPDAKNTLRHFIHSLREKLEPGRRRYGRSEFVLARGGGYQLNPRHVNVDADDFERETKAGLSSLHAGEPETAAGHLRRALELYQGPFLAEDQLDDWTIGERERLRDVAGDALRTMTELAEDPDEATGYLERLAAMEPLDVEVQRDLIAAWLRRGRRGKAIRHYRALQSRLMRELGESVTLDFAELSGPGR